MSSQADVELRIVTGRSWTRNVSLRRPDQRTHLPLDPYISGHAELRVSAGASGDPLLVFDVDIVLDTDREYHADYVVVSATAEATAALPPGRCVIDVALKHSNTVDVFELLPPTDVVVIEGVSSVPGI